MRTDKTNVGDVGGVRTDKTNVGDVGGVRTDKTNVGDVGGVRTDKTNVGRLQKKSKMAKQGAKTKQMWAGKGDVYV
ncbi:hypothetical protein LS74_010350 [Helicobacter magdeburgensis]|uniref:Uncharacterized protein n=1 Tax=Helicobacter magdeburgensis TaxID=471858 RepID=A0A4U8SVY6_9HELI|nr:hypothetical protein LS74_010350 [Helicobacter magdeburgensis]